MPALQTFVLARRQGPLVVACIVVLGLVVGAYAQGRSSGKAVRDAHWQGVVAARDLAEAQAQAEAIEAARQQFEIAAAIERRHLQEQIARAEQARTTTKIVREYVRARPDLVHCAVDADGLRLWNAANAGKSPGAAAKGGGKPAAALRPAARN